MLFGPEFNFSEPILFKEKGNTINTQRAVFLQNELVNKIKKLCSDCIFETIKNDYDIDNIKVTLPNSAWYFVVATDPSVVEIQTKPSTLQELNANSSQAQRLIFDAAKSIGLKSTSEFNNEFASSHIHIGVESADMDAISFFNFISDLIEHPEMGFGLTAEDNLNAVALADYPTKERNNAIKVLNEISKDLNSGILKNNTDSILKIAERIRNEVYIWHPIYDSAEAPKYQVINLNYVRKEYDNSRWTIEYRAMRGQRSFEDFKLFSELFEKRYNKIKKIKKAKAPDIEGSYLLKTNAKDKLIRFYKFISETGLNPKAYWKYISKNTSQALIQANNNIERKLVSPQCKYLFSH